jgi:hypothetical protein
MTSTAKTAAAGLPAALLEPGAYPHPVRELRLVETHISWVFLTGDFAYKVKKPVRLDFLDFSTLELRRHFCEEELRLNRTFAPDLYLGLSTIGRLEPGLRVDQGGEPVEYAVRMRQFDRSDELDTLLDADTVTPAMLTTFGATLASRHAAAPRAGPATPWAQPANVLRACRDNFGVLGSLAPPALQPRVAALSAWTEREYRRLETVVLARHRDGWFRECHGDLHCANIVLHGGALVPFDALEFDPGLRWIDVMSDLAFLLMDLDARGHAELESAVLDGWLAGSGDYAGLVLLDFYRAYRAGVRAKIAAIRAGQAGATSEGSGIERYLADAEHYLRRRRGQLIITSGVSGTGKSSLAARLLAPLDAVRVRSDVERKRLAGLAPLASSAGLIYSVEMTTRTYRRLAELAMPALEAGFSVIADAAFLRQSERAEFAALARRQGVPFRILALTASRPVLEARVAARAASAEDPSEATVEVLRAQLGFAEPLTDAERAVAVEVDSSGEPDVARIAAELRRMPAPEANP